MTKRQATGYGLQATATARNNSSASRRRRKAVPVACSLKPVARRAFTLIELIAVLVIAGLLAASVTLKLQGPLARAGLGDLVSELQAFDARSRVLARRHDRSVRVEVDLSRGELRRTDAETRAELGAVLKLPPGYAVARFLLAGEDLGTGRATLPVSRQGRSPSYALCLEDAKGRRRWLLAAGLSGEVTVLDGEDDDESAAEAVLASLKGTEGK